MVARSEFMKLLSSLCVELGMRLREKELSERIRSVEFTASLERLDPTDTELEELERPRL